jgi:chemotaxis family two-component system sensor kinase Cph1
VQLAQLFQNLIGNALKFRGEAAPRVEVRAHREDDHWHFQVADNGIGIDPRNRERVFEMFQRLHTRDTYPGTGVGLAIVKKIVERHGGRIWVEPGAVRGTVFHFTVADGAGAP